VKKLSYNEAVGFISFSCKAALRSNRQNDENDDGQNVSGILKRLYQKNHRIEILEHSGFFVFGFTIVGVGIFGAFTFFRGNHLGSHGNFEKSPREFRFLFLLHFKQPSAKSFHA
jgi:hypothetical protein